MKKFFKFEELGTNYRKEFLGGFTTFLAMAYILAVNPFTLSLGDVADLPDALRMDYGAVFVATALAAAVGSLIMGIFANYPISLAPGLGLNAYFAYTVVLTQGHPWEYALAAVFISSVFFLLLTISGLREKLINAIPVELKLAVGAGIGLFITFIGLQNSKIIVDNSATLVHIGDLTNPSTLLAIFGIFITIILMVRGIHGGVFYGMIITAVVGMIFGVINTPSAVVSAVPSIKPTFGALFSALGDPGFYTQSMLVVVLTFLFVDFFDNAGTLVAVANQAGLMKENKLPRAGKALFADSIASMVGSIFGTSTTTSFIESSAGVAAGARTGFAAVVTAGFFLLSLFFFPLLEVVTSAVTTPALVVVGILMVSSLGKIDWTKFEVAVPAFLTIVAMPLTYSIATGIAVGFIFYPIVMIVKGRIKEINPIMYVFFVIFALYFIFLQ
ncbi:MULTISPECIES: NCS2 family permease [Niallia]|uniref:Guanine permease n=1 Tax=Niallia circulans TaxID=1397 RepID=A0A268F7U3_NIACI|nr:NCS2 family permease [Niallia circulans]ECD6517315.1 NCS2 family permease [Salmonella enterica subsp. enterica serovar Paratyphi A]AYV69234.1 NCS2 family permease [Niallia circulans]AYV72368.1 NCS2 family permease [Niallia circulans]NRG29010.1 NCS2 family permease [Niallia circulans]PAD81452.1 guanine permease [Niallia circulans]